MNELTRAVQNKRQTTIENEAISKRLINELKKTKFSISSISEAKRFVKTKTKEIEEKEKLRVELYTGFVEEYGDQLEL